MKSGMVFPGQGSQFVGMGKDLVASYPRIAEIYAEADYVLGFRLSALCFEGDADVLTQTLNAQPAILLHSIAILDLLTGEGGVVPTVVAGHSLGEYSALVAAGVLDGMDALKIVRKRGELMFEAGVKQPGTMAAIIGLETEQVCGAQITCSSV